MEKRKELLHECARKTGDNQMGIKEIFAILGRYYDDVGAATASETTR